MVLKAEAWVKGNTLYLAFKGGDIETKDFSAHITEHLIVEIKTDDPKIAFTE